MKLKTAIAGLSIGAVAMLGFATPAFATNPGTVSGNAGVDCAVNWSASSVLDTDLTNDDPNYPGLMENLAGETVVYSNGGYISAVEPALGDPGYLEVNHFYLGSRTQVWRVPAATDHPINDATVTFSLGDGYVDPSQYTISFDPVSTNAAMPNWGAPYSNYIWTARDLSAATQNADGTWTVALGDLPALNGSVFQFNIEKVDGSTFTTTDQFVAHASLSGEYLQGVGCDLPVIPNPEPTPNMGECQVEFLGTTIWNRLDPDITDRIKVQNGEITDVQGEVNADGWGAGDTRTFRVYGGTRSELTNARYEVRAVQGMTFDAASVSAVATPGGGALQGNGLTEAVEGVGAIEVIDDHTIVLVIDRMPANSSFSFNVTGVLDDTTHAMVLHHRLIGDDPNCEPTVPPTEPEAPPTDPEAPAAPETPEAPAPEPAAQVTTQAPAQLAKTGTTPADGALGIAMILLSGAGALLLGRRITARGATSLE